MALIGAVRWGLGMAKGFLEHKMSTKSSEPRRRSGRKLDHGVYGLCTSFIRRRRIRRLSDAGHYPDFPTGSRCWSICATIGEVRAAKHIPIPYESRDGGPAGRTVKWSWSWRRAEAALQRMIVCNGHHWDKRFPNYPGNLKRVGFIRRTTGVPRSWREAGAGDRRGKLRVPVLRRRQREWARLALERAQRLLVSAETFFRDSVGRDDEAVVPGVGRNG